MRQPVETTMDRREELRAESHASIREAQQLMTGIRARHQDARPAEKKPVSDAFRARFK
ncbi:hypothetical protein DAERI_020175 [Deinococcus aerius]|uniref:Uncharacterized protein n=2 Tax=Deinococcus TaxID=1298 RepID=A0A2I9DEZ5_9DEIO|nr:MULTISPECIES: hypothetical protein [Deinococcus]MBB5293964.1 hypothetical protein [Deinococcus metallilatus]GBF04578.1 hypothetical protein DAERI_020175 [Deinococcus aerius]GMA17895.1 hypothetical protein GCM10025871_42260 [Deinococcus metallilatus]